MNKELRTQVFEIIGLVIEIVFWVYFAISAYRVISTPIPTTQDYAILAFNVAMGGISEIRRAIKNVKVVINVNNPPGVFGDLQKP